MSDRWDNAATSYHVQVGPEHQILGFLIFLDPRSDAGTLPPMGHRLGKYQSQAGA